MPDPFPAQALHVCQVLAHMLQRVPRPESVQLFTADHWSAPWLQIHLYPDPNDVQLSAYQQAFGGLVTRSRRDGDTRTVVYSELATEVDRVRIQVWNVNESPLLTPAPGRPPVAIVDLPAQGVQPAEDELPAQSARPVDGSESVAGPDAAAESKRAEPVEPTERTDPTEPAEPTGQAEQTGPTDQADQADQADQEEPTDRIEPTEATEPTKPTKAPVAGATGKTVRRRIVHPSTERTDLTGQSDPVDAP